MLLVLEKINSCTIREKQHHYLEDFRVVQNERYVYGYLSFFDEIIVYMSIDTHCCYRLCAKDV
jgi:hypothetical protein